MSAKNFVSKVITHSPKRVKIAHIEAELDLLWAQFNQKISDGQTVMRACMSNLIIYCDNAEEADVISEEITSIVDVHPARVLLLTAKGQPSQGNLEAFVAIYYTPQPDGWQVCGERIDVISTAEAAERLPSVARSQLIGDLPTTLWWASRQPPPEAKEVFFQLAKLANQIIYDNMGWTNPAKAVAAMTRWVSSEQDEQIVYGLAWRRFSIWRKLIREVLDPQIAPDALEQVNLIEINHGPHALPMTWLLVGWLSGQLKWRAVEGKYLSDSELVWRFRHNHRDIKVIARRLPEGEPLIYRLLFDWAGEKGRTCFERLENERIGIVENLSTVPARVFNAQIPKRATLVSAQLAHRDRDKVFENAMKACNAMSDVFQK
jgi:glucose-6-phosphate dehydrogenase assembly protein OpcA